MTFGHFGSERYGFLYFVRMGIFEAFFLRREKHSTSRNIAENSSLKQVKLSIWCQILFNDFVSDQVLNEYKPFNYCLKEISLIMAILLSQKCIFWR